MILGVVSWKLKLWDELVLLSVCSWLILSESGCSGKVGTESSCVCSCSCVALGSYLYRSLAGRKARVIRPDSFNSVKTIHSVLKVFSYDQFVSSLELGAL